MKVREKAVSWLKGLYFPVIAVVAAIVVSAVLMLALGFDPLLAFGSMLSGAVGSTNSIAETLVKAIPICFTALSFALAARCGVFNLGAPGQLIVGSIFGTLVGTGFEGLPAFIHIPFMLLACFAGGGLYGFVAGFLRNRFGANELITTIMMNHIASQLLTYLVSGPMKDPLVATTNTPESKLLLDSVKLPVLLKGTRLHAGLILAILFIVLFYIFLWKTRRGFEMRVVGMNRFAGEYAGMDVKRNQLLAMVIAGGLAGMAGGIELMSVQSRLTNFFGGNIGFDGVAVALLGGNAPGGIAIASVLFGMLASGANKMQMLAKVPYAMVYTTQGLIILFIVGRELFHFHKKSRAPKAAQGAKRGAGV